MQDDLRNNISTALNRSDDESVSVPFSELQPISIIIVNYNVGPILIKSVQAALMQGQEVLVVDNGSSDGSVQSLEKVFGSEKGLQIFTDR